MAKKKCYTVALDERDIKLLDERREYLAKRWGMYDVSYADAIRHAIRQTNYKKTSKRGADDDDDA